MATDGTVEFHANSTGPHVNIPLHENGTKKANGSNGEKQNSASQRGKIPIAFERASSRWWDLRMDSKVLEEQFKISSLPQVKQLFRSILVFICISCISWIIYFISSTHDIERLFCAIWSSGLGLIAVIFLIMTKKNTLYSRYWMHSYVVLLSLLSVTALIAAYYIPEGVTSGGSFFIATEVIILIYLKLPFPVPIKFAAAVTFSIIYEIFLHLSLKNIQSITFDMGKSISAHVILLIAVHMIGWKALINLLILRHSTFWKVCQVIRTIQAKDKQKEFKELMIKSVMPLSVAEKLMIRNAEGDTEDAEQRFRPFTMEKMENVSILYADIVGFTKMSANKTAAELVTLLNNLFGRFDKLCEVTGCEKISTLGDCYYCVAGCPEPKTNHAICCVEMGLGMVKEIKEFCKQNNINVNMRVGIHTGYVLCGIVGTKRFKFDVWSNDVTLANGMEQHGIPGRIHISQDTLDCLNDEYIVEDSKLEERDEKFMEKTGKTYLIVERKHKHQPKSSIKRNGKSETNNSTRLSVPRKTVSLTESRSIASEKSGGSDQDKTHYMANSTKEPLLLKDSLSLNSSKQKVMTSKDEDAISKILKQDQLMEYLGQHVSPFTKPRPLKRLRRNEDQKFVDSIKDEKLMVNFYKNKEINKLTVMFKNADDEASYRRMCEQEVIEDKPITECISTRYRLFCDIVVTTVFSLLIFIASFLLLNPETSHPVWIIVFILCFVILIALSIAAGLYVFSSTKPNEMFLSLAAFLSTWVARHVFAGILLIIPNAIVFSFTYHTQTTPCFEHMVLFCAAQFHFLNYSQVMAWMRTVIAMLVSLINLLLLFFYYGPCYSLTGIQSPNTDKYVYIVAVLLQLIFIWLIDRHFELNYRLDFFSDHEVRRTNASMKHEERQVEELLENFIPPHVSKAMKDQPLYSKTHKKVGVIFGTIVNFNELYEEDYEGGMQFIRYLSELISDVDDLLNLEEYKDIEKIKTIGTTMMLASGLNPNSDQETTGPESHLSRLMSFCMAMQDAVDRFNKDMINFQLVLRIGFNHGEVTAGVIGTTKRLYDIWGDTVNTASRMDSTGRPGRIQVSQESKLALEDHYNFEYLGTKQIKGKGEMKTYLLVRDDEDTRQIHPNPKIDYPPF